MKRTALALAALVLALAACTKSGGTVSYTLTFDSTDKARQEYLTNAALRVIERRVAAMKGKVESKKGSVKDGKGTVIVTLSDPSLIDALTSQLTRSFSFRVMRAAAGGETPDVSLPRLGDFKETGITEQHLVWLTSGTNPLTLKGAVSIKFSEEGQAILKNTFAKYKGKKIAIFVQGLLVSQLISDGAAQDTIQIDGIPTADLADVFADDVNAGTHVKFAPAR